ncbi:YqzG/YhdC family protein [Heyndrickxia oleronia]|nr:YqzG/YhdC family protein [Heyndrickxia oleronia]
MLSFLNKIYPIEIHILNCNICNFQVNPIGLIFPDCGIQENENYSSSQKVDLLLLFNSNHLRFGSDHSFRIIVFIKAKIKKIKGGCLLKKLLICLFITVIFSSHNFFLNNFINTTYAQQKPIPSYAKWGQIAIQKTKEKYPQAKIIDYLHIGSDKKGDTSLEKFKLWLKQNNKEFGVFVDILFDSKTEQIIDVKFRETTRG